MSGNLRKPEARVFEINSPTKKLEAVVILVSFLDSNTLFVDRNQRFEALIEMPSPTCYCVKLFFNATFFSLVVCQFEANTLLDKANGRNKNRFRPAKTFEKEEKCDASAIPKSTGNIKTNGGWNFGRMCAEYVDSWRERMQTWISISSMHRTKCAVVLL